MAVLAVNISQVKRRVERRSGRFEAVHENQR